MNATYTINTELGGIEITFDEKPSDEVREEMKSAGFRWHKVKKVWYAKQNAERIRLAERLAIHVENEVTPEPLEIPPDEFVDGGGLYDGWQGGNRAKWGTEKELKALLLADFKKAGISATIRFGRGGYTTSLIVTIKITAADIMSFDDWVANFDEWFKYGMSYDYKVEGRYHTIQGCDLFCLMNSRDADGNRIIDASTTDILHSLYEDRVACVTSGHTIYGDVSVFTASGKKKHDTVRAIVHSYNRDCSNTMVDYFDRSIYDSYAFKLRKEI